MDLAFGKPKNPAPEAVNSPRTAKQTGRGTLSRFQLHDPSTGRSWPLYLGDNKIGRGLDNDIVLTHDSISRAHARIRVDGGSLYIEDLKSANGTYVSDQRIKQSMLIPDHLFRIGLITLMIRKPTIYESGAPGFADTWD
jgi:hypothetical protein